MKEALSVFTAPRITAGKQLELEDTEEPFNKVILEELKSKRKLQKGKGVFLIFTQPL